MNDQWLPSTVRNGFSIMDKYCEYYYMNIQPNYSSNDDSSSSSSTNNDNWWYVPEYCITHYNRNVFSNNNNHHEEDNVVVVSEEENYPHSSSYYYYNAMVKMLWHGSTSHSLVAFLCWNSVFLGMISLTSLKPYRKIAFLLSVGIYMITTYPSTYRILGGIVLILNLIVATLYLAGSYVGTTKTKDDIALTTTTTTTTTDKKKTAVKSNNAIVRFVNRCWEAIIVETLWVPLWSYCLRIGRWITLPQQLTDRVYHWSNAIQQVFVALNRSMNHPKVSSYIWSFQWQSFLLLLWYPMTFSLEKIFVVTTWLGIVTMVNYACMINTMASTTSVINFGTKTKTKRPRPPFTSCINLWVELQHRLYNGGNASAVSIQWKSILICIILIIVLGLLYQLPVWFVAVMYRYGTPYLMRFLQTNATIREKIFMSKDRCSKLCFPSRNYMLNLILPDWIPFLQAFHKFLEQLRYDRSVGNYGFKGKACLGAYLGLICTYGGCFYDGTMEMVLTPFACLLGVYFVQRISPESLRDTQSLGHLFGVLFGLFLYLSVEGLCTGHILLFHLTYPHKWIQFVLMVPIWVVWFWLLIFIAIGQIMIYMGNLRFRKFLFKLYAYQLRRTNGNAKQTLYIDPTCPDQILTSTMDQLEKTTTSVQVQFLNEPGSDAGGLRRQWASLLSRALTTPIPSSSSASTNSDEKIVSMLRTWEQGSQVYDVNYDYLLGERQYPLVREKIVLEEYYKLGMILGICLLDGLQLTPRLGHGLCQYLLSSYDQPGQFYFTWEDLIELCPKRSVMHDDPSMRQYCDYEEISLETVMEKDSITIFTGWKNQQFHPPATPTKWMYDRLAQNVIGNRHVNEIRLHMKSGFRLVLACSELHKIFTATELQDLLQGSTKIDLIDWEQNTTYRDNCSDHHPVVLLFWQALHQLSQEELLAFCEFATGQPTPPSGGFFELSPLFNIQLTTSLRGITAHTCFHQIELPSHVNDIATMMNLVRTGIGQQDGQHSSGKLFNDI